MKDKLLLVSNKPNSLSIDQEVIDSLKIDEEELHHVKTTLKLFSKKAQGTITYDVFEPHMKTDLKLFDFVRMTDYPLAAAFNQTTRRVIINIGSMGRRNVQNIEIRDLYAMVIYSIIIGYFSGTRKIPESNSKLYVDFYNSIILKIFAKSYGLTGSYMDLIPELRFFTNLFVLVSFFDLPQKDAIDRAAPLAKFNLKKLKVDLSKYDFYDIKDYTKVLSDSGVMPGFSLYVFVKKMLANFGIINLGMFEDIVRFNATMMASVVNGNTLFASHLQIYHTELYRRILEAIVKVI